MPRWEKGRVRGNFKYFLLEINTGGYGHGEKRKTPRVNG
jgi:hypothetical protein